MSRRPTRFTHRRLDVLLLTIVAFVGSTARAADLADCKSIEDDPKRLACYDAITGKIVTPADKAMPKVVEGIRNDVSGIGQVATQPPDTTKPGTKASSLEERWDLDGKPSPSLFALRPYKPIYILPAFYSTSPNLRATSPNPANDADVRAPLDRMEGKFQFSLKAKLWENLAVNGGSLWFGYTQTSRWQVYNRETSRPFRETDYEPEIMYTAPAQFSLGPIDSKLVGLSMTHQSNGRDVPQSRSWNRIIGQWGLESPNGDWTVLVRPWLRLRENATRDDNPDILNYMGRGEAIVIRKLGNQQIAVTLRHSMRMGSESHGSMTVDWAFPVYGYLKGHVQAFSGYGENLLDYNHHQNSIGVGLSLGEWL
jgi:phospholipase A1/A2